MTASENNPSPKNNQIQNLTSRFNHYVSTVYPTKIPEQQMVEVHQAFFAGCAETFKAMRETASSGMPENQCQRQLEMFEAECFQVLAERVQMMRNRN